ncbi:hypothetical protein FB451DRAFT_1231782 [Mycena latifolia]|nr:hypothetical protein FB451DRAFT_1231782 [Mycena latifolia]
MPNSPVLSQSPVSPSPGGILDTEDDLGEANAKESNSSKTMFDRLTTAVEALKQQPQSTDKKTAFWTAYQKLADEFDRELLKKYGNNLDTSLIFAGLFSAVSSAFIIQIQPEFQPDPNPEIQTRLLQVLVQNLTGVTVPGIQVAEPTRPMALIVVAQSLLYFSLFSTLLAALLAVLGKQWLLHYDSIGERGTIQERGLERQRKVDGLRRWKFDAVMQIFPLLLQFSLLLFAVGLSFYLWTVHLVIASMVLGLTSVGFVLYSLMVISSIMSPDSPFQTSLSVLLRILAQRLLLPNSLHRLGTQSHKMITSITAFRIPSVLPPATSAGRRAIPPHLPQFHRGYKHTPHSAPGPAPIFDRIPEPSQDISAIIWALETSTDPKLVEAAAAIVPDLQWPINLNLQSSLKRLADIFQGCFDHRNVREGMEDRAASCLKAFGVLEMVSEPHTENSIDLLPCDPSHITSRNDELTSLVRSFRVDNFQKYAWSTPAITRWTLVFISAQCPPEKYLETVLKHFQPEEISLQDPLTCADFLFCMNSFFSPPTRSDLSVLDKSEYCSLLMALLFENLAKRLTAAKPLDRRIADYIVNKVAQFPRNMHNVGKDARCRQAVYSFCAIPGLQKKTRTSALQIVQMAIHWLHSNIKSGATLNPIENVDWVYTALESTESVDIVGDLLQVLFLYRPIQNKPTIASLRTILWAISPDPSRPGVEDPSTHRMKFLALHVLCSASQWFNDDKLGPLLRDGEAWQHMGVFCMQTVAPTSSQYIGLGNKLSQTTEWDGVISQDFAWFQLLPRLFGDYATKESRQSFCSVLSRLWSADEAEGAQFGEEKPLAMSFTALANAWNRFNFSSAGVDQIIQLTECSVATAFCARVVGAPRYEKIHKPSQRFRSIIMVRLGGAITQAWERAKQEAGRDTMMGQDRRRLLNCTGDLLMKLVDIIQGELMLGHASDAEDGERTKEELRYWRDLQTGFDMDLEEIRQLC